MAMLMAERVERPASLFGSGPAQPAVAVVAAGRERGRGLGGGLTLDDAIVGAWEGLSAQAVVACPLCGGGMRPHAAVDVAGRCGDCGTTLS
ncbi:MAG TPA: hypothetical protein VFF79_08665 [Conexibacter sp.]|jgi:hypothetical protein|nr:hypothetical protein [Conexibacter sp.]